MNKRDGISANSFARRVARRLYVDVAALINHYYCIAGYFRGTKFLWIAQN